MAMAMDEDEEVLTPAVEEVRMTVDESDDPTLPVLTFRVWFLGILSCLVLSFFNMFFSLRKNQLQVKSYCAQILVLPVGRAMAALLPRQLKVPLLGIRITLNPGPFNVKEHVLITAFADAGATAVFALHFVTIVKAFYKRDINFVAAAIVTVTIQLMGFGFVGVLKSVLVQPSTMWWPSQLVQVSLFRTLHENEPRRPKAGLTRMQFFLAALACSCAYYVLPGHLFRMLSGVSLLCLVWPRSVLAQQVGSGMSGLGLGSFALDWSTITGYLGSSPLATPFFVIVNLFCGFVISLYVLVPLAYWKLDLFGARRFPIFSKNLYASNGLKYNHTRVLTDDLKFDVNQYNAYSSLHMSTIFVLTHAAAFATVTSALSQAIFFHGSTIWKAWKGTESTDIHGRLMRAYKPVPCWWFTCIFLVNLALSILACELYNDVLQLRWWGVILGAAVGFVLALPIALIYSTTNLLPSSLYVVPEYIIGYLYPGRPFGTLLFRGYSSTTMLQSIQLMADLKLGQYMKVPPRSMFAVQAVGTFLAAIAYLCVGWWLLESTPNICDADTLPANSQWTCPHDTIFFDESVIWGLIGPRRMFGRGATYNKLNWAFPVGFLVPAVVWLLRKLIPKDRAPWLKYVIAPVIISAVGKMPYATPVNYWSWLFIGFVFNHYIFKYHKRWWKKHNYVLSSAMDAGVAFMGVAIYFLLDINDRNVSWWGNSDNQCPVATCPTAPGIKVKGCPGVKA